MTDTTITNADVEALAGKLESMRDQFSDSEYAALHAVFNLAGAGIADAVDVEGFGDGSVRPGANFEFTFSMIPQEPFSLNRIPTRGTLQGGNSIKFKLGGSAHK